MNKILKRSSYINSAVSLTYSILLKLSPRFYYGKSGPRDGYSKVDEKIENMSRTEVIRNGLKLLKTELIKWKEEVKEKILDDPILAYRPGEIDIAFRFDNKEDLEKWVNTSDSDYNEGYSKCHLVPTPYGTVIFQGVISNRVPLDGRTKKAGYCNMTSAKIRKSFMRETTYDWMDYTHLVFKVRGDGRSYMLNLLCPGEYDVYWNDIFHYVLYTRGGPYWQLTKVPFSKFFFGAKGRIQDMQSPLPQNRVVSLGITVGDGIEGPFSLEIEYVGLEFDPSHKEEFAYEMYETDKYIVRH